MWTYRPVFMKFWIKESKFKEFRNKCKQITDYDETSFLRIAPYLIKSLDLMKYIKFNRCACWFLPSLNRVQ